GGREVVDTLAPGFAGQAAAFGLDSAVLRYEGEPPTVEALEQRYERDLERGSTGLGPHLDDVAVLAGERDLRGFGSQGEQRLAVLSLLLAEADVLAERGDVPPLLLLDDVLSELDPERRRILVERIRFAPGPLPALSEDPAATHAAAPKPRPEHLDRAASLTAGIEDEELREAVARAAAASLARESSDRAVW